MKHYRIFVVCCLLLLTNTFALANPKDAFYASIGGGISKALSANHQSNITITSAFNQKNHLTYTNTGAKTAANQSIAIGVEHWFNPLWSARFGLQLQHVRTPISGVAAQSSNTLNPHFPYQYNIDTIDLAGVLRLTRWWQPAKIAAYLQASVGHAFLFSDYRVSPGLDASYDSQERNHMSTGIRVGLETPLAKKTYLDFSLGYQYFGESSSGARNLSFGHSSGQISQRLQTSDLMVHLTQYF